MHFENITEQDISLVKEDLPEIDDLTDPDTRQKVTLVLASFLRESSYARISDAVAFPGLPKYDLARHTRQVIKNAMYMAETMTELWGLDCNRQDLLAASLTHDASKLVEREGADGSATVLGKAFLHGQLAGVRCLEAGLSPKIAHLVTFHPFTPPHVHVKPQYVEMLLLTWADLGAADPIFFLEGKPTHLEFEKRFFQLD